MAEKICDACHAKMDADSIFCNECGHAQSIIKPAIEDAVADSGSSTPTIQCGKCGHQATAKARFCPKCAFDLSKNLVVESVTLQCPQCKKAYLPKNKFCRHCAFDLSSVQKKPSSARFCTDCGKPFVATDKFCRHCSADLADSSNTVAVPIVNASNSILTAPPVDNTSPNSEPKQAVPIADLPRRAPHPSSAAAQPVPKAPPDSTLARPMYSPAGIISNNAVPQRSFAIDQNYALWADRFLAALIDLGFAIVAMVVLYVAFMVISFLLFSVGFSSNSETLGTASCGTCFLFFVIPPIGYFLAGIYNKIILVITRGYSIGQSMMGLRVVDSNGNMIDWTVSFLRLLCTVALGFTLVGALLDLIFPLFDDPKRQTLHDKAVGTFVIKIR